MMDASNSAYIRFLNYLDAIGRTDSKGLNAVEEQLLNYIAIADSKGQTVLVGDLIALRQFGSQATLHGRLKDGWMIDHLDHLVLTTAQVDLCIDFYTRILGMRLESFVGGTPPVERRAFKFGNQKINLHVKGKEFEPKANAPTPGSLDICFVADRPIGEVVKKLQQENWPIIEGPVIRTGANSKIISVYVRDPDKNLIEISEILA